MRELHGRHEADRHPHRHAHDAAAATDTPAARAHDAPKHAAHDSLKLKMLLDPEARKAEFLKYQKAVGAYEARHAAGQDKPDGGDRGQAVEQLRRSESRPEHVPAETQDKPAAGIAKRRETAEQQEQKQARPERSWLPRADVVQAVSNIGMFATSIAVALNDIPGKWDAVAASAVAAVVANVAWANRRWKEKHGDRSEG
jgi:hypothetical protein